MGSCLLHGASQSHHPCLKLLFVSLSNSFPAELYFYYSDLLSCTFSLFRPAQLLLHLLQNLLVVHTLSSQGKQEAFLRVELYLVTTFIPYLGLELILDDLSTHRGGITRTSFACWTCSPDITNSSNCPEQKSWNVCGRSTAECGDSTGCNRLVIR